MYIMVLTPAQKKGQQRKQATTKYKQLERGGGQRLPEEHRDNFGCVPPLPL